MNDTTQTLLRSVLKILAGYLVQKGLTDQSTAEVICAGLLGIAGVTWGVLHRRKPAPPVEPDARPGYVRAPGNILPFLAVVCCLSSVILLTAGCAHFSTTQDRTHPDGTKETTHVFISTLFDSHNEVGKLRTTMTDKSQGIGVGSISENSSSTNLVEMLRLVGAILQSIPK